MEMRIGGVARRLLFGVLALLVAVGTLQIFDQTTAGRRILLRVRDELFLKETSDVSILQDGPVALSARGFLRDARSDVASLAHEIRTNDPELAAQLQSVKGSSADVRANEILHLLRGASRNGTCGLGGTFLERFRTARGGAGCCSDYSELFITLANLVHLDARELSTTRHTVVEYFNPASKRWVLVDPMYALIFPTPSGLASLDEVATEVKRGATVAITHVVKRPLSESQLAEVRWLYGTPAYDRLIFTAGTNVIEIERSRRNLAMLPRAVQQLVQFISGVRPAYLSLTTFAAARDTARSAIIESAGMLR